MQSEHKKERILKCMHFSITVVMHTIFDLYKQKIHMQYTQNTHFYNNTLYIKSNWKSVYTVKV